MKWGLCSAIDCSNYSNINNILIYKCSTNLTFQGHHLFSLNGGIQINNNLNITSNYRLNSFCAYLLNSAIKSNITFSNFFNTTGFESIMVQFSNNNNQIIFKINLLFNKVTEGTIWCRNAIIYIYSCVFYQNTIDCAISTGSIYIYDSITSLSSFGINTQLGCYININNPTFYILNLNINCNLISTNIKNIIAFKFIFLLSYYIFL